MLYVLFYKKKVCGKVWVIIWVIYFEKKMIVFFKYDKG